MGAMDNDFTVCWVTVGVCLPVFYELSKQGHMWLIDAPAEPYYISNLIHQWLIPLQLGNTPNPATRSSQHWTSEIGL